MEIIEILNPKYVQRTVSTNDGTIQYSGVNYAIQATIDGTEMSVPLDLTNRHYAEIMRQVDAGTLTITDAE